MPIRLPALGAVLMCLGFAPVSMAMGTELYVCTDASGVRTYQNSDSGQGCVLLNLNPITVVPAAKDRRPSVKKVDDFDPPSTERFESEGRRNQIAQPAFSASDDRAKILQEELRVEESKLTSLKEEYKKGQPERNGDERNYQKYLDRTSRLEQDIRSTQENVDILKREIGKLQR